MRFIELPLERRQQIHQYAELGILRHRSKCPVIDCKGLLIEGTAFIQADKCKNELIAHRVLCCDRRKCGCNLLLEKIS